jgi:2-polyprenyl-3-methyl-5-hydroxy-6-metoxy-1,4-benzoquinol methylase
MSERSFAKRPCLVCGCSDSRLLMPFRFASISDVALLDHYDLVACSGCGAAFADDIPEQAAFDRYYRELSKYENQARGGVASAADTERFREVANLIAPFIQGPTSRILEIGCATGGLLAELRNLGYVNVTGMDPSPGCVQAARDVYQLNAFQGTLSDIPNHRQQYDFVILIGVLEHLRDAGPALLSIRSLLSPGGRLFVGVPDASRLNESRNAPFQAFSLEHINYFSPRSLSNLAAAQGFALIDTSQVIIRSSETTTDPVLIETLGLATGPQPIVRDHELEPALRRYIESAHAVEARTRSKIAALADGRTPIIVWGTGAHTLRLLASSRLGDANIRFYVDSNPHYQGKPLKGVPIRSPQDIVGHSEPILISSWLYQREIERQLRDDFRLSNEIVRLYEF